VKYPLAGGGVLPTDVGPGVGDGDAVGEGEGDGVGVGLVEGLKHL